MERCLRFPRSVTPELLDGLDAADPRALRSRRDLQTVNTFMGTPGVLARALHRSVPGARIVELGSGDGTLLLRVARRIGRVQRRVHAVLVDQRPSLVAQTRAGFAELGWDVEVRTSDVFEFLARAGAEPADVTVASLFLHHFDATALSRLLHAASRQTRRFVACEPLRAPTALMGASLLGLIGCNDVTRHDAIVSVRAGFRGRELSDAWPAGAEWRLAEWRSGPFTHAFVADHVV